MFMVSCPNTSIFNPQCFDKLLIIVFFLTPPTPSSASLCTFHFLSQDDCQPCLRGYYCDAVGLSVPSGQCWEGFFCLEGADRPDPPLRDSRGGPCPKGEHAVGWRRKSEDHVFMITIGTVGIMWLCGYGLDSYNFRDLENVKVENNKAENVN